MDAGVPRVPPGALLNTKERQGSGRGEILTSYRKEGPTALTRAQLHSITHRISAADNH